jgi:hypothetical protein
VYTVFLVAKFLFYGKMRLVETILRMGLGDKGE